MTPDEHQLLGALFERVRNAAATSGPRDAEAEAFIADQVRQQPYAPYLLAQSVIVQEETLKAAAARIEELETRLRDAETKPAPGSFLGSVGKSILGGGAIGGGQSEQRPDSRWTQGGAPIGQPQQMPQGGAPGGWGGAATGMTQQGGGSGFLKGALGAAAGVAGGMLLANSLSGLFGQHGNPFGSTPNKAADLPADNNSSFGDSAAWNERDRASAHNDSQNDRTSGNDTYNDDARTDTASGSDDWSGGDDYSEA